MATTTIPWGDGSGDNLYFSADAFEGDQNVLVSSDANAGEQRSKTVTFSASGVEPKSLGIIQLGSGSPTGEGGGPVPYGYIPLRYVQTDSEAYIDTGINGNNNNLVIEAFFQVSQYVQYGGVFGNYVNETTNCTRLILSSATQSYVNFNSRASGASNQGLYQIGGKAYVKMSYGKISYSGTSNTISTINGTTNNNNIILCKSSSSQVKMDIGLMVYRFIIADDGTIVRDFLPAKRVSDDAVGLYDVINDTFYPSASSTPFVAGPEVNHLSTVIEDLLADI